MIYVKKAIINNFYTDNKLLFLCIDFLLSALNNFLKVSKSKLSFYTSNYSNNSSISKFKSNSSDKISMILFLCT